MKNLYIKIGQSVIILLILLAFGSTKAANTFTWNNLPDSYLSPPPPTAYHMTGGGWYCQGGAPGIAIGLDNSDIGVTYTLYQDGVPQVPTVAGTGFSLDFGVWVGTHHYEAKGTNGMGTTDMLDTVLVTRNETITPSVTITDNTAEHTILAGTSVTFSATAADPHGDCTFQWYINGGPISGATNYQYTTSTIINGDYFSVVMTDTDYLCVNTRTATSIPITMIVVDKFWTGVTNSLWNNATNWNPAGVPTQPKNVFIPNVSAQPVITTAMSVNDLRIQNGTYVTIANSGALTVKGKLYINGPNGLLINFDGGNNYVSGSLIDNGIEGTGNAQMGCYLSKIAWHYISSPISSPTAGIFLADYLRTSDPSRYLGWGDWIVDPATPLQVMRGYAVYKPQTNNLSEIFSGNLNTGIISFTGSRSTADTMAGWHLVGNPYPSSIDLNNSNISWGHFEPVAYFWDEQSGYRAYPTTGTFGTHTQFCPPVQGFFVHIEDTYTGGTTLTFSNDIRIHYPESFLKDAPAVQNGLVIKSQGLNNNYYDLLSVHFTPDATSGYDVGYDALKRWSYKQAPQIYTVIDEKKVTCNALPFEGKNTAIQMGFSCGLPGIYTLTADSLNTFSTSIGITLEDIKTGITQDLKVNPVYSFSYDTLENPNRFILHFSNPTFGINDLQNVQSTKIYSSGNTIYVKSVSGNLKDGTITVYDLLGKEIFNGVLSNQVFNKITPNAGNGYYQVRVVTSFGVYNAKVYLGN